MSEIMAEFERFKRENEKRLADLTGALEEISNKASAHRDDEIYKIIADGALKRSGSQ